MSWAVPAGTVMLTRRVASSICGCPSERGERCGHHRDVLRLPDVDLDHAVASPLLELRRGSRSDRFAMVDDHDPAREVVGLVEVLGREGTMSVPFSTRRRMASRSSSAATGVEAGGGLVEEQDPGLADEARAQVELASHATG